MTEAQPPKKNIKILNDEPANNSAFDSHQDIAEAIYDLVINEERGHRIGLIGSWGSGKSTVVNLLENKLCEHNQKEKSNIQIFTFDAWLHESDPIRRSFIEKLMAFYHPNFIDKESTDNKNRVDEISRRKEDQKITTTPRIKPTGIIIAVLYLISVSFASFLMDDFKESKESIQILDIIIWLGCYVWPLLLLIPKRWRNFASVIFNESTKEFEHTIIKTPDPTAIEFQGYFSEILKEAQDKKTHKLIIVLDNLDRISDEDAISMLTTMRSFFADHKRNNVWVIVPFDVNAIKRMFADREIYADERNEIHQVRKIDSSLVESFIEKTFNIKFYITPPIVTDNQEYFFSKIEEAFSEIIGLDDKTAIFHLYEREGFSTTKNTPRKINTFINNLGSMYRIWGKKIPIRTQALYCLKRDAIEDDLKNFLSRNSPHNSGVSAQQEILVQNNDWDRDFAAMFFGVDKEKARHVLAGDELKKGLEEGRENDEFLKLADIHGFSSILREEMLNLTFSASNGGTLSKISYSLNKLEERTKNDISFAWRDLRNYSDKIESFGVLEDKTRSGLRALLEHTDKKHIAKTARNILAPLFLTQKGEIKEKLSTWPEIWVEILSDTHSILKKHGQEGLILEFCNVEEPLERRSFLVKALEYAANHELDNISPLFAKMFSSDQLQDSLTLLAPDGKNLSEIYIALNYLQRGGAQGEFSSVVDKASHIILNQDYTVGTSTASHILGTLGNPEKFDSDYARTKLKNSCENGTLYGHINHHKNSEKKEEVGRLMALAIIYHLPSAQSQFQGNNNFIQGYDYRETILKGQPDINDEIFVCTLKALYEFGKFERYIQNICAHKEYTAFASKSLIKAVKDEAFAEELDVSHFVTNYELYRSLLKDVEDDVFASFEMEMISKQGFVEAVSEGGFSGEPEALFSKALSEGSPVSKEIACYLKSGLEGMNTEEWKKSVKNWIDGEDSPIYSFYHLYKNGVNISLSLEAADALIENLEELSAEKDPYREFISALPNMLKSQGKKLFSEKLKMKLIEFGKEEKNEVVNNLIGLFGDQLVEKSLFKNEVDDLLNWIITPAIDRSLLLTAGWLKGNASKFAPLFNDDQNEFLEDRIKKAIINSEDESVKAHLAELATEFGFDLSEPEEDVEDSSTQEKSA